MASHFGDAAQHFAGLRCIAFDLLHEAVLASHAALSPEHATDGSTQSSSDSPSPDDCEQLVHRLLRLLDSESSAVEACFAVRAHHLIRRRSAVTKALSSAACKLHDLQNRVLKSSSSRHSRVRSPSFSETRCDAAATLLAYARLNTEALRLLVETLDAVHGTKSGRVWLSARQHSLSFLGGHAVDELLALTIAPVSSRAPFDAAAAAAALDEAFVTCPICFDVMWNPVALPCAHRYSTLLISITIAVT
eukprot:10535-Heterococcus_DN1.PRE.2